MVDATFLKKISAVSAAVLLVALSSHEAQAQTAENGRVNQDELASFYGRMNVVVGSGARAFGMGGAFLARADDATAASWNPAGLSYLRRTEFSLVGVHNDFLQKVPREVFDKDNKPVLLQSRDQLRGSVADFVGFAFPVRVKGRAGAVQLSYQRSFSFSGKRTNTGDGVRFDVDGTGGFDSLSLSSGVQVTPELRLGVSVNRWINGFSQTVTRTDRQTVLDADASNGSQGVEVQIERQIQSSWDIGGTNFNVGALFTPTPTLNLGVVLKTPFTAKIDLSKNRMDTTFSAEGVRLEDPSINSYSGDVRIRFPLVFGGGISYRASNTVTLSADFTRTRWSKASITNFFSLAKFDKDKKPLDNIDFYDKPLPFPAVEESVNGQVDTDQLRLGAEWVLRLGESGDVVLPLRAGFFRDAQPFVAALTTEAGFPSRKLNPSFTGITLGAGITVRSVLFDVAYIRETGEVPTAGRLDLEREIKYNRFFASMMVRFGPRR